MKRFLTAVVVMFLAMNTSAASKQILINEIVVEANSNVPDEVIQSETTLVAGKWYTEDQIKNGVAVEFVAELILVREKEVRNQREIEHLTRERQMRKLAWHVTRRTMLDVIRKEFV